MASRKRPRRSLSLAGDGEDGANSADPSTSASAVALGSGASAAGKDDAAAAAAAAATAAVRKRSRASVAAANAEAAAAAAAAASFAEEQAAMFENLDEEKEYSNWFPRQAGFNTLSRSQINKDIRDLNASAHPAPVESEDEELDGSMYMLFDAGLGSRVSSSSSSSSGLSSSSRSHQRAAQSGGVKQEAGAGHAQATHDSAARPPPKTLGRHATPEVLRDVWSNELLYYRWRIKKRSLEMHEVLAERRHAWETYVALRSTLIGEIRRLNQQRDEHAHVLQQLQRSKDSLGKTINTLELQTKAAQLEAKANEALELSSKQQKIIAFLTKQQEDTLGALTALHYRKVQDTSGTDEAARDRSVASVRVSAEVKNILDRPCPPDLAELFERLKAEQAAQAAAAAAAAKLKAEADAAVAAVRVDPDNNSSGGDNAGRRTSSRLQRPADDEESIAGPDGASSASPSSGENIVVGGQPTSNKTAAAAPAKAVNSSRTRIYSRTAAQFPRGVELLLSPAVVDGDDAQILMPAGQLTHEQRRLLEQTTDLGRWEADRILLAKAQAAQQQIAADLQQVQDRERKQRRVLAHRTEDCARFARAIAKVRADYAKKKRQWQAREQASQRAHELQLHSLLSRYDPDSLRTGSLTDIIGSAMTAGATPAMTRSQIAAMEKPQPNEREGNGTAPNRTVEGVEGAQPSTASISKTSAPSIDPAERSQVEQSADTPVLANETTSNALVLSTTDVSLHAQLQSLQKQLNAVTAERDSLAKADSLHSSHPQSAGGSGQRVPAAGLSESASTAIDDTAHEAEALKSMLKEEQMKNEKLRVRLEELSTQLTQYVNENSPRVRPRRNRK